MRGSDPYSYPEVEVLRNKLNIKDASQLDMAERQLAAIRIRQGCPEGNFDLAHLQKIHRHIFQDIYDWAGQVRTVEICKGGSSFQPRQFIAAGMGDIHRRLVQSKFLRGLTPDAFAKEAGRILGDVNYVHPFREGNGRTQLQYLKLLGARAKHDIDLTLINRDKGRWIEASRASHNGDYGMMSDVIRGSITRSHHQGQGKSLDDGGHGR